MNICTNLGFQRRQQTRNKTDFLVRKRKREFEHFGEFEEPVVELFRVIRPNLPYVAVVETTVVNHLSQTHTTQD